ncbi:MAG: hypothetical protein O3A47_09480 [Chloroflexi bacterium]|nr:hypothetical protein [Chloroflexota bacterium]
MEFEGERGSVDARFRATGAIYADVVPGPYRVTLRGGAEIVCHETPSGGEVFSVGSNSYPSSLPVDSNIQAITRNVPDRSLRV